MILTMAEKQAQLIAEMAQMRFSPRTESEVGDSLLDALSDPKQKDVVDWIELPEPLLAMEVRVTDDMLRPTRHRFAEDYNKRPDL